MAKDRVQPNNPRAQEQILNYFRQNLGGDTDVLTGFAPGRVNLIGEHTDYNGGHVMPCALNMGVYGGLRPREDNLLRFFSFQQEGSGLQTRDLCRLSPKCGMWTDYICGVLWALEKRGITLLHGFDLVVNADLPAGAGLSSSAALEVLSALLLNSTFHLGLDGPTLAEVCQEAENGYCGVACGIMDQFSSMMGRTDCAIFLRTSDLYYEYVPLPTEKCSFILTDSGVRHRLSESGYNVRRMECEKALADLNRVVPVRHLCDLSADVFESVADQIRDPVCRRRARHVITENDRTVRARDILSGSGNIVDFGALMNASHCSLRDDFEVSCPELDLLAETAVSMPETFGSRMTGGGFGGCTVSAIVPGSESGFMQTVGKIYREKAGKEPKFLCITPSHGAALTVPGSLSV